MQVISTNVAVRRPDPSGRHEFSGIDKQPQDFIDLAAPGPHYGDGSGVRGDIIGDTQHHGGNDKAVYAYSREDLDYWQSELSRPLASGGFGENSPRRASICLLCSSISACASAPPCLRYPCPDNHVPPSPAG